jgi:hypothetical protein
MNALSRDDGETWLCLDRPLALVLSPAGERRAALTRALAQHAGLSAVGLATLAEGVAVARSILLAAIVIEHHEAQAIHGLLGALRAELGARQAAIIVCASGVFASASVDVTLSGGVAPQQVAARTRAAVEGRRQPARSQATR